MSWVICDKNHNGGVMGQKANLRVIAEQGRKAVSYGLKKKESDAKITLFGYLDSFGWIPGVLVFRPICTYSGQVSAAATPLLQFVTFL